MPDQRRWSAGREINIPTIMAIATLAATLIGALVMSDRRQTMSEGEIKLLHLTDKGIIDHAAAVNELAVRDRAEMRDDIKEIKTTVNSIAVQQKRGR